MPQTPQKPEEKNSKASIIFMIFGIALVIASLFVLETKKGQTNLSSISPSTKTSDAQTSTDYKARVTGIEINNQRIGAEITKDQELQKIGNQSLNYIGNPENISNGVGLPSEANNQLHLHDRLKEEREYSDIVVPNEVAQDRADAAAAVEQDRQDRRVVIENLRQRAAAQNLDVQYDPKTGEIVIERIPQSETLPTTGGGGVSK